MVREGNVEEAVRLSKEMDAEVGKLGASELTHSDSCLSESCHRGTYKTCL